MLSLKQIEKASGGCRRCQGRSEGKPVVFGKGNPRAKIIIVLESPTNPKEETWQPFNGEAGNLLHKILEASHIKKEEVYLTHIVKCCLPRNRTPKTEEVLSCRSWLDLEIATVKPEYIICFGLTASRAVLRVNDSLKDLRGRWHKFGEIKVLCTYRPKTLLKAPQYKRCVWQDFQLLINNMGQNQ